MSAHTMRPARGFTLIELMIAATVMIVAIVACTVLLLAATRLSHDADNHVDSADRARMAMGDIVETLERSGMGSPKGVMVNVNGTPTSIIPVFGLDGTTGAGAVPNPVGGVNNGLDDLWIIAGSRSTMGEACVDRDASVLLTDAVSAGSGTALPVICNTGLVAGSNLLAVSQGGGALLTNITKPSPTTVGFAEMSVLAFAPTDNGFRAGDTLMGVEVTHYFVAVDPGDIYGHTALFKASGTLTVDAYGRPFVDVTPSVLVHDVEDLQLAYGLDPTGLGNPNTYNFVHGLSPVPPVGGTVSSVGLRSVRVTVVAKAHSRSEGDQGGLKHSLIPLALENHTPVPTPDSFERTVFTRRVELFNLSPGSL